MSLHADIAICPHHNNVPFVPSLMVKIKIFMDMSPKDRARPTIQRSPSREILKYKEVEKPIFFIFSIKGPTLNSDCLQKMSFTGKLEVEETSQPVYYITNNDDLLKALHPVPQFETRDDIKPWLHEKLDPSGFCLVIERSDASKVVFKCKNIHRKSSTARVTHVKLANGKTKRVRSQPEECCPFRIRVSYSVKHKSWSINIIKPEHNPSICSNFGHQRGVEFASTPTNTSTAKRSWTSSYTPASTTSPLMSVDGSPVSILTPASEIDSFEFERFNKKQKRMHESPLANIIDPLDSLQLPEDLSDLKYLEEENFGANPSLLELDYTQSFHFAQNDDEDPPGSCSENIFELDLQSKVSNLIDDHDLLKKMYDDQPTFSDHSLNINADIHGDENPDSLMYILSASNSNYSLEELENLDKAMGVDANDMFLLSMFHPKI
jgi:hypothetical protein